MAILKFAGVVLVALAAILLIVSFVKAINGKKGVVSYEDTHTNPKPPKPFVPKSTGNTGRSFLSRRRRNS